VTKTIKGKGKGSERARKWVKGSVKVATFILLFTVYPTLPRPSHWVYELRVSPGDVLALPVPLAYLNVA
jgi:hypothetical protein